MRFLLLTVTFFAVGIECSQPCRAEDTADHSAVPANAFFAFDNGVGRRAWTPKQQAKVLAELGYDGISYTGTKNIPAVLQAFDVRGLNVFAIYVGVTLAPGKASYDPGLPQAIEQLKGRETIIWLYLLGGTPPEDVLDQEAVTVIREIANMAEASGLRVALYPHTGFYVATVQDAVRLSQKVDRKNVGASFNLCHFLKLDEEKNLKMCLKEAMPHLFLVSINGADAHGGWDRLIQTLDRGSFDLNGFIKTLRGLGYKGPIGLQCYNIKGDIRENLSRSIKAWRRLEVE